METNWGFQEPIDFEHKQYILLGYLQKIEKELNDFKLYPNFQLLSLHLTNINLIIQKGHYLSLTKKLKDKDEEILLSDLVSQEIPLMQKDKKFWSCTEYVNFHQKNYRIFLTTQGNLGVSK